MEVFRLSSEEYANVLDGKGAAYKGARWNSEGTEAIYAASSRALALAEIVVHISLSRIPTDYYMLTIYIPDDVAYIRMNYSDLPNDWNEFPYSETTQVIGDQLIRENRYCVLQIPSAVVMGDFNLIINPFHADFSKIKIVNSEKFPLDKRLFK